MQKKPLGLHILIVLSAVLASCLMVRGDDSAGPTLAPIAAISQETRTEIRFELKAKTSDAPPLRFDLIRVRKEGKDLTVPRNMALDRDKGTFMWMPTPSQAGVYELTLVARDKKDREAFTTARIDVRERIITAAQGPVGDLLRKWYAAGTAAGNTGDFYDNRDREHSPLDLRPYPQLDKVQYSPEERKANKDWALQSTLLPYLVFGNSSTSAPPLSGGSNIRSYYAHPRGLEFLYNQYRTNNLYIYPAHHDHHPGHNGKPFYGDLFPTNSPYLIASQGSSGSDQPFMRALPLTLAAFQPEVKKKLRERGLLMPTVQMIFRSSNKHLADPKDYLTGKAHPTVFEGSWVDDLKMVQMAHEIDLKTIPPMIQLRVVEEDAAVHGQDFFEPNMTETLCDSPAVIARVFRGGKEYHRMVVSAEASGDVNKHPLTFHWAVLRGDAARIEIKPLKADRSVVEIRVPFHERRPVAGPVKLESNRVDIGAFVHNGTYYSAPGFVTFFCLDHEARTHGADGRLLEIGYGVGEPDFSIADWKALFAKLQGDGKDLGSQLLKGGLKAEALAAIAKAGEDYRKAWPVLEEAQARHKEMTAKAQRAQAALKAAEEKYREAQKKHAAAPSNDTQAALKEAIRERDVADHASKTAAAVVQESQKGLASTTKLVGDITSLPRAGLDVPLKDFVDRTLMQLAQAPTFYIDHQEAIDSLAQASDAARRTRFVDARKRMIGLGILKEGKTACRLQSLREGPAPVAKRLTAYEKNMLTRFHAELLSILVYPGMVNQSFKVNFVDQRISSPKAWRDIYHYDRKGNRVGWTRRDGTTEQEFNADGHVILEKDKLGRALQARTVKYEYDPPLNKAGMFRTLKQAWDNHIVHYEYVDENDWRGRISKREPVEEKK
jgi:hypothetical protein